MSEIMRSIPYFFISFPLGLAVASIHSLSRISFLHAERAREQNRE